MTDIFIIVLYLLVGIGLTWLAKRYDTQLGDISKTALLLLPLLSYLIISGKLAELEVGGLKAKFKEVTSEKIIDTARAADLAVSSIESNEPNFFLDAFFQQCRPYYVISEGSAKKGNAPVASAIMSVARSVRASIVCGQFQGVVVVDSAKKPVGFFSRHHFAELPRIRLETYGDKLEPVGEERLSNEVMSTELGVILLHPEARARTEEAHKVTVAWNDSLGTAYQKIVETGVEVAMIVNRQGRFDGIISRSAIESRVVSKLIEAAK